MNIQATFVQVQKPHVSINVTDVDASVAFYTRLFGVQPTKHYHDQTTVHSVLQDDKGINSTQAREGYAKFDLNNPSLNFVLNQVEYAAGAGSLSHLGIQLQDSDAVMQARQRIESAGLKVRDEMQVSCCYAKQDKFWVADPDGNEWEVFTVIEHLSPEQLKQLDKRGECSSETSTCNTPAVNECCN